MAEQEDVLCCPVCLEKYHSKKPAKLLPCYHTVCEECINALPLPQACPLDRKPFTLPEGGAAKLINNYALMHVVERSASTAADDPDTAAGGGAVSEKSQQKDAAAATGESPIVCSACEASEATCQCVDCEGDALCAACWGMHTKFRASNSHITWPWYIVPSHLAGCKTRLESRMQQLNPVSYMLGLSGHEAPYIRRDWGDESTEAAVP